MDVATILREPRIALDSTVFIGADRDTGGTSSATQLLRGIATSGTDASTSVVSLTEVLVKIYQDNVPERLSQTIALVTANGLIDVVDVTGSIAKKAADLRGRSLKDNASIRRSKPPIFAVPDSLHLATAIVQGIPLFVTSDRDFPERTIDGVRIVHLRSR